MWFHFGCLATGPHLWPFAVPHGHMTGFFFFPKMLHNDQWVSLTTVTFLNNHHEKVAKSDPITWWITLWPSQFITVIARLNYHHNSRNTCTFLKKKSRHFRISSDKYIVPISTPKQNMSFLSSRQFLGKDTAPLASRYVLGLYLHMPGSTTLVMSICNEVIKNVGKDVRHNQTRREGNSSNSKSKLLIFS